MRVGGLDFAAPAGLCDEFLRGDITQPLAPPWFEGVDTVFHLAGKVHALSEVAQDEAEYFRINSDGTRHVLEAAKAAGVRRFVFFSTIKAMSRDEGQGREDGGWRMEDRETSNIEHPTSNVERRTTNQSLNAKVTGERAATEEDVIEPDTPYGKSKLEAEKLVLHGGYVPEPVVLRLCMVYGPGAKGNIQKMIEAIRGNRFPPLPEFGNRRSMVHASDVVAAAILAAEHDQAPGQIFIISDGETYSTREMYELICQALHKRPPGWSVPFGLLRTMGRLGDVIGKVRGRRFVFDSDALAKLTGSAWFSSEKARRVLGFQPQWTLAKALPEMVSQMRIAERGVGN